MRQSRGNGSVIVSGAGGYVGRHVVTALADRGFDVVALARTPVTLDGRAKVVYADILAPGFDIGEHVDPTSLAFIHLAWQDGFRHDAPSHLLNLSAHFRLLTAAADAGIPRIAALGTMHEVGYWEGAITEDTPTNPRSLYGIAKDALRRGSFLELSGKTELAWLRCYYILGDDRQNSSVFTRILEAADEGRAHFPFTTGRNKYDFISVQDLADQIAVAATTPGLTGVVNCGSGVPIALADRAEDFIRENGLDVRLEYGAFPDRPYDSPGVWGDASRILGLMREAGPAPATAMRAR